MMMLSYRAQAFSVDNLLKPNVSKPQDTGIVDDALQQSAPNRDVFSHSEYHSIHSIMQMHNGNIEERSLNYMAVNEGLNERLNVKLDSSKQKTQNILDSDNTTDITEHKKHDLQDELIPEERHHSLKYISSNVKGQSKQNIDTYQLPFTAKNITEKNKSTSRSQSSNSYMVSPTGPPSPSCFCHGEVPFCHHPGILSVVDSSGSNKVIIAKLCHADLWTSFHGLGTEMIITKSGRRMFPAFKVSLDGLSSDKLYSVRLDFMQPDTRKYRYIYHSSRWMVSASGDTIDTTQSHKTSEEPISGHAICSQIVSFERLKLTNTEPAKSGQISLVSMQKFQPQVVIEEVNKMDDGYVGPKERYVIVFPQTSFMAVTAYQNHQITTLKIASNPFAKGFREPGKTRIPYESFLSHVPLSRHTSIDYRHGMILPHVLPAILQRDDLNVRIGKRHNDGPCYKDFHWTPEKKATKDANSFVRHTSRPDTTKAIFAEQSSMYQPLPEPFSISSYVHPNQERHHLYHILQLQHEQNSLASSVSRRLHPHQLLYQSPHQAS